MQSSQASLERVSGAVRDTLDLYLATHPGFFELDVDVAAETRSRVDWQRDEAPRPAAEIVVAAGGKHYFLIIKEAASPKADEVAHAA
jgi:hypothetical protein